MLSKFGYLLILLVLCGCATPFSKDSAEADEGLTFSTISPFRGRTTYSFRWIEDSFTSEQPMETGIRRMNVTVSNCKALKLRLEQLLDAIAVTVEVAVGNRPPADQHETIFDGPTYVLTYSPAAISSQLSITGGGTHAVPWIDAALAAKTEAEGCNAS